MNKAVELLGILEAADREEQEFDQQHDILDEVGRLALAAANPRFQEYLEYRRAKESVVMARDWAVRNEGHRIITHNIRGTRK